MNGMKELIKPNPSFLLMALLGLVFSLPIIADDGFVTDEEVFPYTTEEKKWQEQDVKLPEYPDEENLHLLKLANSQFKYYIDLASVSVGAVDAVARYSVIIVSSSGVRNVLYEGIRCDEKVSRTYAFGTGSGSFRKMASLC